MEPRIVVEADRLVPIIGMAGSLLRLGQRHGDGHRCGDTRTRLIWVKASPYQMPITAAARDQDDPRRDSWLAYSWGTGTADLCNCQSAA